MKADPRPLSPEPETADVPPHAPRLDPDHQLNADQLEEERRLAEQRDERFRHDLLATLPHLRAFARGLSGRADVADDLVQEAAVKAWVARDRFTPGTNMRAWTFTILRNNYLSDLRRARFHADYDPDLAERLLVIPPEQEEGLHLQDMEIALQKLSPERREALLLVGASGFSYEEAAEISGRAIGTVKSRVARARAQLIGLLEDDPGTPPKLDGRRSGRARPDESG